MQATTNLSNSGDYTYHNKVVSIFPVWLLYRFNSTRSSKCCI